MRSVRSTSVKGALAESGLPSDRLELELSETSLMPDPEAVLVTLRKLEALGAAVSIGGFGAGASSLPMLKRYPVRRLSLDANVVAQVAASTEQAAVAAAAVALGHALGLRVVAVQVASEAQRDALRAAGCDEISGPLAGETIDIEAQPAGG